jgi:hypothetical protein
MDHEGLLDREVLGAIVGAGREGATVEDILGEVDARQKLVLSRAELNAALMKLAESGLIVQRTDGRYATPAADDAVPVQFEPVTEDDYEEALSSYRRWFTETLRELDSDYLDPQAAVWPKLRGEWRFADDHYASELEVEGLMAVLDRMIGALHEHGLTAQQGPISNGPGSLEFSITGRKADDAEAMLRVVRPSFEAVAPHGSSLVVDEWDPTGVGPSMAEVADEMAREMDTR